MKTVAFASPYCLIDYSSGAAIATDDCLDLLASSGFRCHAYCLARLDFREEVCFEETLANLGLPYDVRKLTVGPYRMKLVFTRKGDAGSGVRASLDISVGGAGVVAVPLMSNEALTPIADSICRQSGHPVQILRWCRYLLRRCRPGQSGHLVRESLARTLAKRG